MFSGPTALALAALLSLGPAAPPPLPTHAAQVSSSSAPVTWTPAASIVRASVSSDSVSSASVSSAVSAPADVLATGCAPSVVGRDALTGQLVADGILPRALTSTTLLTVLEPLDAVELTAFVSSDRELVEAVVKEPPPTRVVEGWWSALSPSHQARLLEGAPELFGNLDGVPYAQRDAANRALLARDTARLQRTVDTAGKGAAFEAAQRLIVLDRIEEGLRNDLSFHRSLITLDTTMPGRAAIAIGDLQSADYISVLIPGALLSIRAHMAEWTKVTADIYDGQVEWLRRFDRTGRVATISWIGYQTPDVTNMLGTELAEDGSVRIANLINGLDAMRSDDEPYVSVLAHSYGATVTMLALQRKTMSIDALAMVGSPGGVADNVDQLAVPPGHVWVGEAAWDPVVNTGFFGVDPGSPEFGANPMEVSGATDPVTGSELTPSVGHDWYLEPGTESLRNLSLIGIDEGRFVTDGSAADAAKTLALLEAAESDPD